MLTFEQILQQVRAAFQDCFEDEAIDAQSDFFDLGGDSLALVDLTTTLEAVMGFEIHPSTLLYHPTVEELAVALEIARKASN